MHTCPLTTYEKLNNSCKAYTDTQLVKSPLRTANESNNNERERLRQEEALNPERRPLLAGLAKLLLTGEEEPLPCGDLSK